MSWTKETKIWCDDLKCVQVATTERQTGGGGRHPIKHHVKPEGWEDRQGFHFCPEHATGGAARLPRRSPRRGWFHGKVTS